ncbi:prostatic spermine-binding protein-like isoform X2 [Cynoglossus semilaevis]|uniref:prostatic spermine-binding protein-like isoform X2 n=1 Tax=Cynoglossus semilaevis TaxID=244447 RepID=UPI00049638C0|nr:prostatic spermine-binding protein-like isoform X2 [Cynoglossus semilaevis]
MSFSNYLTKKVVGMVADAVEDALTKDEDDEDKKDGGGFLSDIFKGDKKKKEEEEDDKLFSFGGRKNKKDDDDDDDKGGFFSKLFHKDDDDDKDKGKEKKSGFAGLFSEQAAGDAVAAEDDEGHERETGDQDPGFSDGDLLSDLMEVADETSRGN